MEKIKLFIVDDHKIVRDGLKINLADVENIEIIGEAADSEELFEKLQNNKVPDIMILDISLPDINGIEITRILQNKYPEIKVIMFTAHTSEEYIFDSIQAGAKGFITKETEEEELINSIIKVQQGSSFLSGKISNNLLVEYILKQKQSPEAARDKIESLTKRELEIVKLIAEGLINKEIADKLHISYRTVETHRNTIMKKLELNSVVDLVKFAIRKNIISL